MKIKIITNCILFPLLLVYPFSLITGQYQDYKNPADHPDTWWETGSLPGRYAVNEKGESTYRIPLSVAPGTAGFAPTVSICYNSRYPSGEIGIGWYLDGISEIVRVNKKYYYDNTTSSPDLSYNDVYALDSIRLILISGTHGTEGAVYGPEYESFTRVIVHGSAGNGPSWFEALTKDGLTIEYGNTADSKVEAPGQSSIYRWRVNKIRDSKSNYIEFSYNEDQGESTISEIRYTGNSSTGLVPYNKVKFNYASKNDPSFNYIGGAKIPLTRLLTSIRMETEGGTLVREYYLKYHYDFYTHLNEIYLVGNPTVRINSTVFGWGAAAVQYNTVWISAANKLKHFYGDFNGDGISDLLWVVRKSSYTTSDLWTLKLNECPGTTQFTGALNSTFKDFFPVDADGDGKTDVLRRRRQTSPSAAEIFEVYTFNGSTLARGNSQYDLWFYNADANMTLYSADFDGDGDIDYMGLNPDLNLAGFKGFQPSGPNPSFNTPNVVRIIDFNGDKRADILVIKNSTSYIYSFNPATGNWDTLYYSTSFPLSTDRIYPGDFNGDGKTDILYYRSGWYLRFATGTNSFSNAQSSPMRNYDPGASLTDNNYFIGDFNGDRRDDVAEMYKVGSSVKMMDVYYSKGNGTYIKESNTYSNQSLDEPYYTVYDYNSDGQKDIIRYDYNNSSGPNNILVTYLHKKERRDYVHGIRNGAGELITVEYENLNHRAYNYLDGWTFLLTRGTAETFPLRDFSDPTVVVSRSYSSNGVGYLQNMTKYKYEGAKRHLQGKGLNGFIKIIATNDDEKIKHTNISTLNGNYYFLKPSGYIHSAITEIEETGIESVRDTTENQKLKADGEDGSKGPVIDLVLETFTSVDTIIDYGNKRIFAATKYTSRSNSNEGRFEVTSRKYDAFGNNWFTRTGYSYYSGNPVQVTSTDTSEFASYGNYGIPNRVTRRSSTSVYAGKDPYTRVMAYEYNQYGNLVSETSDPGLSGSVNRSFFLNAFGLPDSVTINTSGINPLTEVYQYDEKYRFRTFERNPAGLTVSRTFYPGTGREESVTGSDGMTTSYTYDAFGRLYNVVTPDGITTETRYLWDVNGRTKATSQRQGSPLVTKYYDILGREVSAAMQGQFQQQYGWKEYNQAGYLIKERPFGSGLLFEYLYDNRGRVDTVINSGNNQNVKTRITWKDYFPEIHYPDSTVRKVITNALGQVISVIENYSDTVSIAYNSQGKTETSTSHGTTITFTYDHYGRQVQTDNPNSGITSFSYDNLGRPVRQTDANGDSITFIYDNAGRRVQEKTRGEEINYEYYSLSGVSNGKLKRIYTTGGPEQVYRYDNLGRISSVADSLPGELTMTTTYGYDSYGNNTSVTFPSGITLNKIYDNNGYLSEIRRGTEMIWKLNYSNELGQPVHYSLGDPAAGLSAAFTYDQFFRVATVTTGQMKQSYSFDPASGNLVWRDYRVSGSQTGLREDFRYDSMNRLVRSFVTGLDSIIMSYGQNGNISFKTDAGGYGYDVIRKNAVTSLTGNPGTIKDDEQDISYNSYNLTTGITEGDMSYAITYSPLKGRVKSLYNPGTGGVVTKYYSGSYEKIISGGVTRELHYVESPFGVVALIIRQDTTVQTFFAETDHLGSIIGLLNQNGTYAERYSYDPWGRRRNPTDWSFNNVPVSTLTDRGFTGHEYLDQFWLINMNGRIYDPVLARFLSADPIIQSPYHSQSYNGYSYCLNNPLKLVDPGGYKYEEPFYDEPANGLSTWSFDLWWRLKDLKKDKYLTYLDVVGIAYNELDSYSIKLQRAVQNYYGAGHFWITLDNLLKLKVILRDDKTPHYYYQNRYEIIIGIYLNMISKSISRFSDFNWVQTAFHDGILKKDGGHNNGFYNSEFEKKEIVNFLNYIPGAHYFFEDTPNAASFYAYLTLCGKRDGIWEPVADYTWGYNANSNSSIYFMSINEVPNVHLEYLKSTLKFFNRR